jgi:hypothetical protein
MLDDIRNHDAEPTPQETEWMSTDVLSLVFRAAVLAVIALSVGLSATIVLDQAPREPVVAAGTAS